VAIRKENLVETLPDQKFITDPAKAADMFCISSEGIRGGNDFKSIWWRSVMLLAGRRLGHQELGMQKIQGKSILLGKVLFFVQPLAQYSWGLEHHYLARSEHKTFFGLRVSAPACIFLPDRKLSKTADEHVISLDQGVLHNLQEPVDYLPGFLLTHAHLRLEVGDQFIFGERHVHPLKISRSCWGQMDNWWPKPLNGQAIYQILQEKIVSNSEKFGYGLDSLNFQRLDKFLVIAAISHSRTS
jgi:hypothetical protein